MPEFSCYTNKLSIKGCEVFVIFKFQERLGKIYISRSLQEHGLKLIVSNINGIREERFPWCRRP